MRRSAGFAIIEILVGILLIVALVAGSWYVWHSSKHKGQLPVIQVHTSQKLTANPSSGHTPQQATQMVQAMYETYVAAIKGGDAAAGLPAVKSDFANSLYAELADKHNGYDPVTCAQDIPPHITAKAGSTVGGNINVTVDEGFSGLVPVIVSVNAQSLKIVGLECPNDASSTTTPN